MRRYTPNITFYFSKSAIAEKEVVMFEESLGESRLPYLAKSLIQNRQNVGFRFGGCPNIDRLIRSSHFQEFAALIVEHNCTFGYFGMPTDLGFMAMVRAWWLHSNPETNFLDPDQYRLFSEKAIEHLVAGARRTWTTMLPDSPIWEISHAMQEVRGVSEFYFKAFEGKLQKYLKP